MTAPNEAAVLAAFRAYLGAFLANDMDGIRAVCLFPLAHIANGETRLLDDFPIRPGELMARKGWHTTVDVETSVVGVSESKGHLISRGTRVRADGSVIERYAAFYALAETESGWKIFAISDVILPTE